MAHLTVVPALMDILSRMGGPVNQTHHKQILSMIYLCVAHTMTDATHVLCKMERYMPAQKEHVFTANDPIALPLTLLT